VEINWKEKWKEDFKASTLGKLKWKKNYVEYWNEKAEWFDKNTKGDFSEANIILNRISVTPDMTLLDIGAGTGRFTIPFAKILKKVTAIEPSGGMIQMLKKNLRKHSIDNVEIIKKKWEDIDLEEDIEKHDVVISPYSLSSTDVGKNLLKMDSASTNHVFFLTWFKRTFWNYEYLWPKVYGEQFIPAPDYIYIANMLHDEQIYANIEIFRREKDKIFDSMEEILDDLKQNLHVEHDNKDEMLIEHVKSVTRKENGKILHHGVSRRAMIYWNKMNSNRIEK
jgi:SAM-dependent methyltransferase